MPRHLNMKEKPTETVVLLHGLWMKSIIMRPLAHQLRQTGFRTCCFSYPSLKHNPRQNASQLRDYVSDIKTDQLHFVAHSLGGIVLMHYFNLFEEPRPGRVVLLGSPVRGSDNASKINKLPFSRFSLGRSVEEGFLGDSPLWPGGRDLGVVAGTRRLGVGNLLGRSHGPNDGAVYVDETRIDGLDDHICMSVSHSGMLMSKQVAEQVTVFLKTGRFSAV